MIQSKIVANITFHDRDRLPRMNLVWADVVAVKILEAFYCSAQRYIQIEPVNATSENWQMITNSVLGKFITVEYQHYPRSNLNALGKFITVWQVLLRPSPKWPLFEFSLGFQAPYFDFARPCCRRMRRAGLSMSWLKHLLGHCVAYWLVGCSLLLAAWLTLQLHCSLLSLQFTVHNLPAPKIVHHGDALVTWTSRVPVRCTGSTIQGWDTKSPLIFTYVY